MTTTASSINADRSWIRTAFFVPDIAPASNVGKATYRSGLQSGHGYSEADIGFTDTTPGGNFVINPSSQFTRFADPKRPGINRMSKGQGVAYTRFLDKNKEVVHFQFGTAEFNSTTNFWGRYHDPKLARLANTGDASDFTFFVGKVLGYVLTAPLQVVAAASNFIMRIWSFLGKTPYSKFYYMKPNMPLFTARWTTIYNRIAVGTGIVNGPEPSDVDLKGDGGVTEISYKNGLSSAEASILHKMLPDVMRSDGGIDLYKMMTRGQRLDRHHRKKLQEIEESVLGQDVGAYEEAVYNYMVSGFNSNPRMKNDNLPDYLNSFYKGGTIGQGVGANAPPAQIEATSETASAGTVNTDKAAAKIISDEADTIARKWDDDSMAEYFKSEFEDGGGFLSLEVDHQGSISEGFSNSFRTSDLQDAANSMSSSSRNLWQNLSGGNITDNVLGNAIESLIGGVGKVVSGVADSVGLGGLSQLGGAAFADMPEFWDAASTDMPTSSYSITLSSPYGNKLSLMLKIYPVLTAIIAAIAPVSTGRNSYTSPLLCSMFSQSRSVISTGMFESVSIERGTGTRGWSEDRLPTEVKITFTVKDLDTMIHIPIAENSGLSDLLALTLIDEDSAYTNYMTALSGITLADQHYLTPRLRLGWRSFAAGFNTWLSPAKWAAHTVGSGTMANKLMGPVFRGTSR